MVTTSDIRMITKGAICLLIRTVEQHKTDVGFL